MSPCELIKCVQYACKSVIESAHITLCLSSNYLMSNQGGIINGSRILYFHQLKEYKMNWEDLDVHEMNTFLCDIKAEKKGIIKGLTILILNL